jgi:hypothetical protein
MRKVLGLVICGTAAASQAPTLADIAERLGRLERENQQLRQEVKELRAVVERVQPPTAAPGEATVAERLEIQERRVDEQAQTKVEAAQRFPVKLSGMIVANVFRNGSHVNGLDLPTTAARGRTGVTRGISFRQSIIGMEYGGAQSFLGGHVRGSLFMDFVGEGQTELNNFAPARVRTASVALEWKSRSLVFAQDKPLFSQRDPNSFSFSGISPLTSSGNLWRWQPQIRFEQRLRLGGEQTTGRAQVALFQTSEDAGVPLNPGFAIERRRPGLQGRFEIAHRLDESRRIEVAPGFHVSESRVLGRGFRSNLVSVDWFASPFSKVEWSGIFWAGQNVHHFGAFRQGLVVAGGNVTPVRSRGGWTQVSVPFTGKVSLNLFGGTHDDRNGDILRTGVAANRTGAVNLMYRVAPNVIVTLEGLTNRTTYRDTGTVKNNRYDLSIVYLF